MIMATMTINHAIADHRTPAEKKSQTGFFARVFNRLIAARELEARRRAAIHLGHVSDYQLKSLGMSARDIELYRHGTSLNTDLAG